MKKDYCELQFKSDPARVRSVVRCLLEFIDMQCPSTNIRDDLRLVFSELLYNAVIHGNKEDNKKVVCVQVEANEGKLRACIKDEGAGFEYRNKIQEQQEEKALQNETGRGMTLVTALTDKLSINKTGNQIRFEKRLS